MRIWKLCEALFYSLKDGKDREKCTFSILLSVFVLVQDLVFCQFLVIILVIPLNKYHPQLVFYHIGIRAILTWEKVGRWHRGVLRRSWKYLIKRFQECK